MSEDKDGKQSDAKRMPRRDALKIIASTGIATGAIGGGAGSLLPKSVFAASSVRKKVKLTYWTWADNPMHQKMSVDAVELFNKSQTASRWNSMLVQR